MHSCFSGLLDRRRFLLALAMAAAGACSTPVRRAVSPLVTVPPQPTTAGPPTTTRAVATTTTVPPLPAIPKARPGPPSVLSKAPGVTSELAWTVDDGTCAECVAGYVDFAERTGIPITFLPNGVMRSFWETHSRRLSPLIARGQVQIANHTWSHPDLVRLPVKAVATEITRNESWIEDTFQITARPYFRPPYGSHNVRVDRIAGDLGYTSILTWNATLGDATVEAPGELMDIARRWIAPGAVLLGHANHPTVLALFDQLMELIRARRLRPVTLDQMFGTSRASGVSARR
jgi:peptidoglycan/xylan/chitin deacetylase (PgdA/CDA1 family)